MQYYKEEEFIQAKKQRRNVLVVFFCVAFVYLVISTGCLLWYLTLPYQSPVIAKVKAVEYSASAVFVIFSFIYLFIPFKRVNRYYKMMRNLSTGLRENFEAEFLRFDTAEQEKDGVDMKALIFSEWNKYKQVFYERKVLVPLEKEFPDIKEHQRVKFVTQGNVLISYEIVE